jgi:hypothetical protein
MLANYERDNHATGSPVPYETRLSPPLIYEWSELDYTLAIRLTSIGIQYHSDERERYQIDHGS